MRHATVLTPEQRIQQTNRIETTVSRNCPIAQPFLYQNDSEVRLQSYTIRCANRSFRDATKQ